MITRNELAPIWRTIAELHVEWSPRKPMQRMWDGHRRNKVQLGEMANLGRRAASVKLLSERHLNLLDDVLKGWDVQSQIVRALTIAAIDLFRIMDECGELGALERKVYDRRLQQTKRRRTKVR